MKKKQEKQVNRINRLKYLFTLFGTCLLLVIGGMLSFSAQAYAADLQPGEVRLTKTAKPVADMVNQWDVTVRVEGKNHFPPPSTDVVLIIDTSDSMNDTVNNGKSRLAIAKEAAKNFVNQVLKDNYVNRISLVTYAGEVTEYKFDDGASWNEIFVDSAHRQLLLDKIESLTATGGTFTQGAIRKATDQLTDSIAINRNIVLLSDGVPTYSYDVRSPYNQLDSMDIIKDYNPGDGFTYYATRKGIPAASYDYSQRIGHGGDYATQAPSSWFTPAPNQRILANHAYAAIDEAGFSKAKMVTGSTSKLLITDFYTVGIDLEAEANTAIGQQTLKEIASSPDNYFDTKADDLDNILSGIGGQIIGAMKKADITDPMGKGFKLTDQSKIKTTQGDTEVATTAGVETISWDLDSLTTPVSNDPNETVFYAEMTYRVDANNNVISQMDGSTGLAPTNGKTTIDYIAYDKENEFKEKKKHDEFKVPTVKPTIVSLKKTVLDDKGNEIKTKEPEEKFKFSFGDDAYTKDDTFVLQATESIETVHPWDATKEYSITEILPAEPEFKTTITINNQEVESTNSKFTFSYNDTKKTYDDQKIHVINQRIRREKDVILHIRQTVINKSEELVVPRKGYYYALKDNNLQKMNLVSGSTTKDTAAEIEKSLFTTYKIVVDKKLTDIDLTDIVPEYYSFYGYILTTSANNLKTEHVSSNSIGLKTNNKVLLDYQTVDEYWLTMIIEPKFNDSETSPRPYSWSYKINQFGN
ncbi:VWA domain-containing protein [Enterococcus sp. LJL99]